MSHGPASPDLSFSSRAGVWLALALSAPLVLAWLPGSLEEPAHTRDLPAIPWALLAASLAVAGSSALVAVAVGTALAAVISLTDLGRRPAWATLLVFPFLSPPMVWTLGQVYAFGPGGLAERLCGSPWRLTCGAINGGHYAATVLVLAQIHAPLALLLVGRGLDRLHHAGFEAALLMLPPVHLTRWLIRALRPELTAAWLLAFALGLGNFSVPHVLQCRLYVLEIYSQNANYLNPHGALWLSLPLIGCSLAAAVLMAWVERTSTYAAPSAAAASPLLLGRWTWPVRVLLAAYVGFVMLIPLAAMLFECRSPADFLAAVRAAAPETENTLRIAALAGLLAGAAGLGVGIWAATRGSWLAELLIVMPLGVPALLVGVSYARAFSRSLPLDVSWLGATSGLVIIGLAARTWPFAARAAAAGRRRIDNSWHEASLLAGLSPWRRWRWISAPLMAPHASAGAAVAMVLATGEVEISQLLCAPGSGTLALRLFTFLHFGPLHVAASLAVLQLLLTAVPVAVYYLWTSRTLKAV